jgi:sugar phosphate isomerase/epimerase
MLGALSVGVLPISQLACAGSAGSDRATDSLAASDSSAGSDRISRIGIQLYTLRREMAGDFDGTLAQVASIGYREVEFAGYYERTPAQVRAVLERTGLDAPSSHVGDAAAVRGDWQRTLDVAKEIGHRFVTVAWLAEGDRRSLDDYRRLAELFNQAGERAKAAGLRFAYHNHDFEFATMDGKVPYDVLLEGTDPSLVSFELDLYWITKAGFQPLDYFARHPGRFPLVHVKDMDGSAERRFADVGKGTIDFAKIFAQRRQAGIEHYFVEHDEPQPNGIDSARASYAYLSRLTFR